MEPLTKENRKQILGNKFFLDDEIALADKLIYHRGSNFFDNILLNKSQKEMKAVIHIIKYPSGIEIKLAKSFKSYSIGISFTDIKNVLILKGTLNKIKFICASTQIEFSFKESDYSDISNFLVNKLKLSPNLAKNENEFDSNINIVAPLNTNLTDIKEVTKYEQNGGIWIIIGYFFAILGGLIGMFIGYYLSASKIKLKDGSIKNRFDETTGKHGVIILIIAGVMMIIGILLRFL